MMKPMRVALCICSLSLFAVTLDSGTPSKDDELKKWQGTWIMVSLEQQGKEFGKDEFPVEKIVIKGDQMKTHLKIGGVVQSVIKLNSTSDPKQVDFIAGQFVYRGIYQFKGNKLTVCVATTDGGNRPKQFSGKDTEGSGGLTVYQRIK